MISTVNKLKIAFVSYEYPPDTAFGGIGTYVYQVSKLLASRGHTVEVFTASHNRTITESIDGLVVNRVLCTDREIFRDVIVATFAARNELGAFDVLESPEYYADGLCIKEQFPNLPLVVKLHTPSYLIKQLNYTYLPFADKAKFMFSGLIKKRKWLQPFWKYNNIEADVEYKIAHLANQIHTPSVSLGDIVSSIWRIPRHEIANVPNPYSVNENLLKLKIIEAQGPVSVTLIGRLEVRKGIVELCKAIPVVLKEYPEVVFKFIGHSGHPPNKRISSKAFIEKKLTKFKSSIQFKQFALAEMPLAYQETDICIFPSLWENFPNVCLEAMSAGKAVVASREGGMKDMLENPEAGVLIDPLNHLEIANAIIALIKDKEKRVRLGEVARESVLAKYNTAVIGELMESWYLKLKH